MREMYCLGDYVSQIGSRVKKYKGKPSTERIYNIQKYLGVNIRKCLVNNVLFGGIVHLTIYEKYVSIVCKSDFEKMREVCDRLNKIGDMHATCFSFSGTVVFKLEPMKFIQVAVILADKYGSDLKVHNHWVMSEDVVPMI